jgi:hypothetical protein
VFSVAGNPAGYRARATQILQAALQDPSMAAVTAQIEPLAREGARLDHRIISQAAARLAGTQ